MSDAVQQAVTDYVAVAVAETLAQVPPGYRLVGTELEPSSDRNQYVLVSTWEPE